jgi:Na+-driven multidrug efflux pump
MFICASTGAWLAYPLMSHFIDPAFAERAFWVSIILCVGVFFNGIANIPYSALHALGIARQTGLLHLIELALYLPILYWLVHKLGIEGAAVAWTLRTALDCAAQSLMVRRAWRVSRV